MTSLQTAVSAVAGVTWRGTSPPSAPAIGDAWNDGKLRVVLSIPDLEQVPGRLMSLDAAAVTAALVAVPSYSEATYVADWQRFAGRRALVGVWTPAVASPPPGSALVVATATTAQIAAMSTVLAAGEVLQNSDTRDFLVGDGSTAASALLKNGSGSYGQLWATPDASTALTGTLVAWTVTAVDCTAGAGARTLPLANSVPAKTEFAAKKGDTGNNNLVVSASGSDKIFGTATGSTTKTLTLPGEAVTFVSDGVSKYTVRESDTPSGALSATYAKFGSANTWAGAQDFTGATVTGINALSALSEGGAWVTSTAYAVGKVVTQAGERYACVVAHTSGTFATDLAASKWVLLDAVTALAAANNLSDLVSASTARTNLGLGTAATMTPAALAADSNFLAAFALHVARSSYKAGWYTSTPGSAGTNVPTEAQVHYAPIWLPKGCSLDRLVAEVTSGGTSGALVRLGLCANTSDGLPGTYLIDASTADGTTIAVKELTVSYTAPYGGLYWGASVIQGGAGTRPTMRSITGQAGVQIGVSSNQAVTFSYGGYVESGVTGAFPGSATPSGATGTVTRMAVRYV